VDRILLNGLVFFGKHGCHAAENELGQKFVADIELECDLRAAGESDDLNDTIDYVAIYNHAREVLEGEPAKLLEHLAQRIADFCLIDNRVVSAWVRLRKPQIALPGVLDYIGVEITRSRDEGFDNEDFDDEDLEDDLEGE
jgi:dihydroneopterin aldolase